MLRGKSSAACTCCATGTRLAGLVRPRHHELIGTFELTHVEFVGGCLRSGHQNLFVPAPAVMQTLPFTFLSPNSELTGASMEPVASLLCGTSPATCGFGLPMGS